MPIDPGLREYLAGVARRLDAAPHGAAGAILEEARAFLGWSLAKLYARLRSDVGWRSGRATRRDKGCTVVPVANLERLAAAQRESVRANGKQILKTPTGASVMEANGIELPVSNRHLNRLMAARKLDVRTQARADAPVTLRSLHPNHVHQVDPSLCVLYYMRGEQHMMDADRFYKNKLDNYTKVRLKVWRYVLWDHTSSAITVRYYEAAGESPTTLFDFLLWAWTRQPDRELHGAPRLLMWDKGSANTAHTIKRFLEALEVEPVEHRAGNARAKGGVEGAQNIVETKFESRLRFEPVESVEALNAAVLAWQNAFNADLIPREDNALKRSGMTPTARLDLWRRIRPEQLRILPDLPAEAYRALLEGREETRKVSARLTVSYRHPRAGQPRTYRVAGLDGVCAGDTVTVRPLLFGDCAIHVRAAAYDGEDRVFRVEPEALPNEWGFPVAAPVIGQEYRAQPDTAADRAGKRMDRLAWGEADPAAERAKQAAPRLGLDGGTLDAHSHLKDIALPAGLPRRGSEISVPDRMRVEAAPLNHAQAAGALARLVDGWGPEHYALMVRLYPNGMMEADLPAVAARLQGAPRLVAVGGGAQ